MDHGAGALSEGWRATGRYVRHVSRVIHKLVAEVVWVQPDVLVSKVTGERPIALIGYSLGARVIFYCLKKLSQLNQHHLVEHGMLAH